MFSASFITHKNIKKRVAVKTIFPLYIVKYLHVLQKQQRVPTIFFAKNLLLGCLEVMSGEVVSEFHHGGLNVFGDRVVFFDNRIDDNSFV